TLSEAATLPRKAAKACHPPLRRRFVVGRIANPSYQRGQSVRSLLSAISVWLGCVLVPICSAADWPNWRGPHHDGISRETGLLKSWPKEGPRVLWEGKLTGGYSSVVVAGGRVFTQMKDNKEEAILCLDADTGKQLWQYRYPCDYADHPSLDKRFL